MFPLLVLGYYFIIGLFYELCKSINRLTEFNVNTYTGLILNIRDLTFLKNNINSMNFVLVTR